MEELTDEKVIELKAAFDMFDKDKDGIISIKELGTVLRNLGQNPSRDELETLQNEIDENGDGTIDFKEFLFLMVHLSNYNDTGEILVEAFKVFDRDDNKFITSHELRFVLNNLGETLDELEVEDIIKEFDQNGDGQIDRQEFDEMMLNK